MRGGGPALARRVSRRSRNDQHEEPTEEPSPPRPHDPCCPLHRCRLGGSSESGCGSHPGCERYVGDISSASHGDRVWSDKEARSTRLIFSSPSVPNSSFLSSNQQQKTPSDSFWGRFSVWGLELWDWLKLERWQRPLSSHPCDRSFAGQGGIGCGRDRGSGHRDGCGSTCHRPGSR